MKCCICGKVIHGYGNNPWGHLRLNLEPIKYRDNDRCCDRCNEEYVIPGRLILYMKKKNSPFKWAAIYKGTSSVYCLFVSKEDAEEFMNSHPGNKNRFQITEVLE